MPPLSSRRRIEGMPYWHQSMIVRRSVWEQIGEFDLSYCLGMDFEWVCRMERAGLKGFYYDFSPVVIMDGGGVSVTREWKSIVECVRALKKNDIF
jgi:GT2 family glycosyltransferase